MIIKGGIIMGKATQDLREEHEAILYVLKILDQMMLSKNEDKESLIHYYDEVLYFLKIFADKCHHGKEENYLFKEIFQIESFNAGELIDEMLQEHAQSRDYVVQMSSSLDKKDINGFNNATVQYRDLLHRHIKKEEDILFSMADNMIDEQAQKLLFKKFEQHEENVVGHGIHEKLHGMIDTWAETFGVK